MNTLPIGVFDSGVGGLTVLKSLYTHLPKESFLYVGDTARLPYGTKSAHTIERYAIQIAQKLVAAGIKLLVIACNTATSLALPALKRTFPDLAIVGVIEPGAKLACESTRNKHIAVIATEATVAAKGYHNAIQHFMPEAVVTAKSCGLFVSLAEEGWTDDIVTQEVAKRYLLPLIFPEHGTQPDCLILGCTHFPVLLPAIQKVVGSQLTIINSADTTAIAVENILQQKGLQNASSISHSHFWVTDSPERFGHFAKLFLGKDIPEQDIELIEF